MRGGISEFILARSVGRLIHGNRNGTWVSIPNTRNTLGTEFEADCTADESISTSGSTSRVYKWVDQDGRSGAGLG